MNKLTVGSNVYRYIRETRQGCVVKLVDRIDYITSGTLKFGNLPWFIRGEDDEFFEPDESGIAYYFAGFAGIEGYRSEGEEYYVIPTDTLRKHLSTYVSPWE